MAMADIPQHLKQILLKICKRHERRGTLSGIMKLGQNLDDAERRPIENFFGLYPLINTSANEIKLSFDRLLYGKNETEIDMWLAQIYHHVGRTCPAPSSSQTDQAAVLCDQLKLAFPRLDEIHAFLGRNRQSFARKLSRQPEKIRENFFAAGKIIDFLLDNDREITLSELGARFCTDSKSLRQGELKNMVEHWLRLLRPGLPEEENVWEEFLVIRDRLTITALIFAPLIYTKNGREYQWINQLYQAGEPAVVSWFHLEGIESCRLAEKQDNTTLITCENEAPFSQLLRDRKDRLLLFTSGFPNRAVRRFYQLLAPEAARCCHWGDSDPAGLRIAAILHAIHPLTLWRCNFATLNRHTGSLLPLDKKQAKAGAVILSSNPDFPFAEELIFTLEHGWLEQESWQPKEKEMRCGAA